MIRTLEKVEKALNPSNRRSYDSWESFFNFDNLGRVTNVATIWQPHHDKVSLFYEIDVPGVSKEDITVSLQDSYVVVRAKNKKRNYEEQIPLPHSVKNNNISAELKMGVLTLKVPDKAEVEKSRLIPIK
jgi:HSP20 family molecular chaperone IbpA